MIRALLVVLTLSVAGCSAQAAPATAVLPGAGSFADAATTHIGIQAGFREVNPLISWSGEAAPAVLIGAKFFALNTLTYLGQTPEQARIAVESSSWGAACFNLMALAGAAVAAGVALGAACWLGSHALYTERLAQ